MGRLQIRSDLAHHFPKGIGGNDGVDQLAAAGYFCEVVYDLHPFVQGDAEAEAVFIQSGNQLGVAAVHHHVRVEGQ